MNKNLLALLISSALLQSNAYAQSTPDASPSSGLKWNALVAMLTGEQPTNTTAITETTAISATAAEFGNVKLTSISEQGVVVDWQGPTDVNYKIDVTSYVANESSITFHHPQASAGFYIGDLEPDTNYLVEVSACSQSGCETKSLEFRTLAKRLAFNDNRKEINHLSGRLAAHLNFAQTHTVTEPFGNDAKSFPNLVQHREALLMVTPKTRNVNQLSVEILLDGVAVKQLAMVAPSALPLTDQLNNGRPRVIYSHHMWTASIPWNYMRPGFSLRLIDNHGREGELAAKDVVFGGAPELVIQNIDVGMLVEPRGRYDMIERMGELATDYFQKIPVSKLVMADYTPLHLRKVTLPNGKVYTKASDYPTPSWHAGDMRSAVLKGTIAMGINYANFGIVDNAGSVASWPRPFYHIVAHNGRGRYLVVDQQTGTVTSKIVSHGYSGGGGMVTLDATRGNEWSHELGHNFGRGHWPYYTVHTEKSGWGWDARHQRFIGNLHWGDVAVDMAQPNGDIVPPFAGEFRFMRDAMGGGENAKTGLISQYTLENPIAARHTQNRLNTSSNLDSASPTGYVKWDQTEQRYVESETGLPAPRAQGVPVITVVGIYDPWQKNASQIYPLIYSNYGNLFTLPTPEAANAPAKLKGWQEVSNLSAQDRQHNQWQQIINDGQQYNLCQFSTLSPEGAQVNMVGYEDESNQRCRASADMKWRIDNAWTVPRSQQNAYALLSAFGVEDGAVTYIPTPELGELPLCSLNKTDSRHDGAGFVLDGRCRQIDGMLHASGARWAYVVKGTEVVQHAYATGRVCQLEVTDEYGSTSYIKLHGQRYNFAESNKFHLNLPMDNHPSRIALSCQLAGGEKQMLDAIDTPRNPDVAKLKGPVIVGQQYGYQSINTSLPNGWFKHEQGFDPAKLGSQDKAALASSNVAGQSKYLCRFDDVLNSKNTQLFGHVEALGNGDFVCSGGSEITIKEGNQTRRLESEVNAFEWLSLVHSQQLGQAIMATADDKALCSVAKNQFYGTGFVNANGQCTQEKGVYWSNGKDWVFSSGFTRYNYR